MNKDEKMLKQQLVSNLTKANAHATFDDAVANLTVEIAGKKAYNLPYTIWQIIEHIRIAQWDILEFSKDARHQSPKWPDEYWTDEPAPKNKAALEHAIATVINERKALANLVEAEDADLYTPFEHGDGQNLLREVLLAADHTSYHTGEIIVLRRLHNDWK